MDRPICHAVRLLTLRELLAVLCEVLLEIQFRIDTGESLELSSSPSHSEWESDSSDDDL